MWSTRFQWRVGWWQMKGEYPMIVQKCVPVEDETTWHARVRIQGEWGTMCCHVGKHDMFVHVIPCRFPTWPSPHSCPHSLLPFSGSAPSPLSKPSRAAYSISPISKFIFQIFIIYQSFFFFSKRARTIKIKKWIY